LAVRLRPEDIVELDMADPARVSSFKDVMSRFADSPPGGDEIYQCGGGEFGFAVGPEGKMSICTMSHFEAYDLRGGSFKEGWENYLLGVRHKKATRITKCTACRMKPVCGMCPANGELENRDAESPVDFLCQVSHLRARTFGLAVVPHGDCEYCEGGSGYGELMRSVRSLNGKAQDSGLGVKLKRYLPVFIEQKSGQGCSGSGCSSHAGS
jgi:radical SAM protein with 4Fe4S-binding SPASM domain